MDSLPLSHRGAPNHSLNLSFHLNKSVIVQFEKYAKQIFGIQNKIKAKLPIFKLFFFNCSRVDLLQQVVLY